MNDLETVKDKVRKLLALSKSGNENEAASALEKANALIDKYGLDEAALRFESAAVKSSKTYVRWRALIAGAVSWLYGCHHYRDENQGCIVFTGESLDVFMASEMFAYLIKTVERCIKKEIRKNAKSNFRDNFKYGMACRLYDRIAELGDACSWAPRRNSKIEEAAEYVKKSVALCNSKPKKISVNKTAFMKGAGYGNGVSLSRQAGHAPVPQLAGSAGKKVQGELF